MFTASMTGSFIEHKNLQRLPTNKSLCENFYLITKFITDNNLFIFYLEKGRKSFVIQCPKQQF